MCHKNAVERLTNALICLDYLVVCKRGWVPEYMFSRQHFDALRVIVYSCCGRGFSQ